MYPIDARQIERYRILIRLNSLIYMAWLIDIWSIIQIIFADLQNAYAYLAAPKFSHAFCRSADMYNSYIRSSENAIRRKDVIY
jgi:hypothetical protein